MQTLSAVFTWVPSSIVWIEKSISGRGFFVCKARMALSIWTLRTSGCCESGAPAPSVSIWWAARGRMPKDKVAPVLGS